MRCEFSGVLTVKEFQSIDNQELCVKQVGSTNANQFEPGLNNTKIYFQVSNNNRSQSNVIFFRKYRMIQKQCLKTMHVVMDFLDHFSGSYGTKTTESIGDYWMEPLIQTETRLKQSGVGTGLETGYCSLDETQGDEMARTQSNLHLNSKDTMNDTLDSEDEDREEEEEDANSSIGAFVVLKWSGAWMRQKKVHYVAKIINEEEVDGTVQFTVNFYEKFSHNLDVFVPCISHLKTNVKVDEDHIVAWLGDPVNDDFGIKFPFDFKKYQL